MKNAAGRRIWAAEIGVSVCENERINQPEALGLYRSAGYREIPPFGDYGPDPLSVFMEKQLAEYSPRHDG